jgi:hypothetical protein
MQCIARSLFLAHTFFVPTVKGISIPLSEREIEGKFSLIGMLLAI